MSKRNGKNRSRESRKRQRPGRRLRWKQWLIYGPLILLLTGSLGYYVLDLYQHPSMWNGILFMVAIAIGTIIVLRPKRKPR